jgi:hypothetical protein
MPSLASLTREQLLALIKLIARGLQNGNPDVAREAQLLGQFGLLYHEILPMVPDDEP